MFGGVTVFNKDLHTEIPGELADFCNRMMQDASGGKRWATVMRYELLGTFVIGEWMSPNKDVFVDVMNLDNSLANFTHEKACELRQRLFAPTPPKELMNTSAEAESGWHHEMQDWNDEMLDREQYEVKNPL